MKNWKIEMKWGLAFSLFMLLWMVLEKAFGFHDEHIAYHPIVTNFVAIPAVIIYAMAFKDIRMNKFGGKILYKQALFCGIGMTLFITLLSPLVQLITSYVITPDFFKNAIAYAVENKYQTREQAEAFFNIENYVKMSLVGTPTMGIVTAAIVAYFSSKKG